MGEAGNGEIGICDFIEMLDYNNNLGFKNIRQSYPLALVVYSKN